MVVFGVLALRVVEMVKDFFWLYEDYFFALRFCLDCFSQVQERWMIGCCTAELNEGSFFFILIGW